MESLELYNSVCYFSHMNLRVALEWLHEILYWDKPKQENSGRETKTKLIQSNRGQIKLNPRWLRMQEKQSRNAAQFHLLSKPQQRWLACDIQLVFLEGRSRNGAVVTQKSAALKDFPQLSLFTRRFVLCWIKYKNFKVSTGKQQIFLKNKKLCINVKSCFVTVLLCQSLTQFVEKGKGWVVAEGKDTAG